MIVTDCTTPLTKLGADLAHLRIDRDSLGPYSAENVINLLTGTLIDLLSQRIVELEHEALTVENSRSIASLRATIMTLEMFLHETHDFLLLPHVDSPLHRLTIVEKSLLYSLKDFLAGFNMEVWRGLEHIQQYTKQFPDNFRD